MLIWLIEFLFFIYLFFVLGFHFLPLTDAKSVKGMEPVEVGRSNHLMDLLLLLDQKVRRLK